MSKSENWAVVIPMANEEDGFEYFTTLLQEVLDSLASGKVYCVIDTVTKDRTLEMARELAERDPRFEVVWAPENRSVVDAYIRGFAVAYENGHELIIEMDAGMSHDPRSLPAFLEVLRQGKECAFGSRFIQGGSMGDSPLKRRLLSKVSTLLANLLLGTRLKDMTSGYQGFTREVVGKIIKYPLLSKGHFYQTEIRYLLRNRSSQEVPIHYQSPSPRVSSASINNARKTFLHYIGLRFNRNCPEL